jgi:hypothetical protein
VEALAEVIIAGAHLDDGQPLDLFPQLSLTARIEGRREFGGEDRPSHAQQRSRRWLDIHDQRLLRHDRYDGALVCFLAGGKPLG